MAQEKSNQTLKLIIRILVGPVVFFIIRALPLQGLEPNAQFALAVYGWIIGWWACTPVPWAVAGLLPLILLPLGGVINFRDTATLYGQRVFFFLMGCMLFGYAFQKHGLAKRTAISILCIKGMAKSGNRLILMIIIISAIVSAIVDDAACVAIMIPIAMALARSCAESYSKANGLPEGTKHPKFMVAAALGVLYGAFAGGMGTPAGVPFNPVAISNLEEMTSYQVSFAQWTLTGVILMIVTIPVFYLVLRFLSTPEVKQIPDASAFFKQEKKELGPMSQGERNVVIVLILMIVLWLLPAVPGVTSTLKWLDIWIVPPIGVVILFLMPISAKKSEMTLVPKDFGGGVNWNILFLVCSGTATAAAIVNLGVASWIGDSMASFVNVRILPWVGGFLTPVLAHLTSGTAMATMMTTIMFPISESLGYNSAILARIIPAVCLSTALPWAGAAPAAAFSSGELTFKDMFKCGIVTTVLTSLVITIVCLIIIPLLGSAAYTFVG